MAKTKGDLTVKGNKTKAAMTGKKQERESLERLEDFRRKFHTAYAQFDQGNFLDDLELIYRGTKDTTANVNSKANKASKKTNNTPNFTYELIESKVNTSVPEARVKSKVKGFVDQARMIQDKIISDADNLSLDEIADKNERNTFVLGSAYIFLNWDWNGGGHCYMGEKEFVEYHTKQVIPQPDVYDEKKMDYIFLMASVTKQYIEERYGVDVESFSEQFPEINHIANNDIQPNVDSGISTNDKVTEIIAFYKDEDGDVGKFVWVDTAPLEDLPKYYYPRVKRCLECDTENSQDADECVECGSKKLETEIKMTEKITERKELSPIMYMEKNKEIVETQQMDGSIIKQVNVKLEQKVIERVLEPGDEIPIPAPKRLPIVKRVNIPLNFSFIGRSDVQTVRDQQESCKKTLSKIEEKVLKSGSVVAMSNKLNASITNETYQVIKGSVADLSSLKTLDLKVDISQDLQYLQTNYDIMKSTLGITDAYQGKYDASAKSGRAKEVQVEQAAGRLQSVVKNKFTFYSRLYELMFEYDLCFSEKPRPYETTDEYGEDEYELFDKHEFLMKDDAEEWYYVTDFKFSAEMADDSEYDGTLMVEKVVQLFQAGGLDQKQLLEVLGALNFPLANRILEQIKGMEDDMGEVNKFLDVLASMSMQNPQQVLQFLQLPAEERMQYMAELGGASNEVQQV